METTVLPFPTEEAQVRQFAIRAFMLMNPDKERSVLESEPEDVPLLLQTYVDWVARDFQCLALIKQWFGMDEVEKLRAEFNALPFIEKMRLGVVGADNVCIVPGQPTHDPLNLLLFAGAPALSSFFGERVSCVDEWVRALCEAGLGGSVLVSSENFPACWNVALTGQLHALLMHDDDGWSTKVGHFEDIQDGLRKRGLKVPPLFAHGHFSHSSDPLEVGLKQFFAKHFPAGQ